MSWNAQTGRYSPSRIHTRPVPRAFRASSSSIRAQSPCIFFLPVFHRRRNWFVFQGGWFCLQRSRGAKVDYRIYGQREDGRKADPLTRSGSSRRRPVAKRAPLSFFQLLSRATPPFLHFLPHQLAVWFRRVSALLPFKPLCMSTVTREPPPSLSNPSRSTITTTETLRR